MLLRAIVISMLILTVVGCAKRPDAILPVDIPIAAYSPLGCPELATEIIQENEKLAALSKQQNSAATSDAVGVFLIGIPTGTLTGGDKEGLIAVSKGKIQALESARRNNKCK